MGRISRLISENGVYHIISKSVEETNLFNNDEERKLFLKILSEEKNKFNVKIFAFCLMKNHYHLLIKTTDNNLSNFIRNLNFRYSQLYNLKNFRKGHLFMDRFKSYLIKNDGYLLNVSRYIHLNPLESNLVKKPETYKWSSYKDYYYDEKDDLIDKKEFYEITSINKNEYINYINDLIENFYLKANFIEDFENQSDLEDEDGRKIFKIISFLKTNFDSNITNKRIYRDLIIYYLINKNYSSLKISLFFNLSRSQVSRIVQKVEYILMNNYEVLNFYNEIEKRAILYEE